MDVLSKEDYELNRFIENGNKHFPLNFLQNWNGIKINCKGSDSKLSGRNGFGRLAYRID